jgi:hypothetical protein
MRSIVAGLECLFVNGCSSRASDAATCRTDDATAVGAGAVGVLVVLVVVGVLVVLVVVGVLLVAVAAVGVVVVEGADDAA